MLQAAQTTLIEAHERLLKPVRSAFYKVDRDRTGLLLASQFADFCRLLSQGISDPEVEALLSSMVLSKEQAVRCLCLALAGCGHDWFKMSCWIDASLQQLA